MSARTDLDQHPVAPQSSVDDAVPIIDLEGLASADSVAVELIARACREWGFFQITNHGIPKALIDDVWSVTEHFFAQSMGDKETLLRTRENPWGYYNNELTKNKRDKKEVFDFTSDGIDPVYRAENRWPSVSSSFRQVLTRYRDACEVLALSLLRAMCRGLQVPATTLDHAFYPRHTGFVRLNYYPVSDPQAGRADGVDGSGIADRGVHHHTDAGSLTVLLQDDVGGLQVYRDGYWHDVSPVAGALVINTGDMLKVWSNDRYHAAIHRVLAMQATDRYSVPFFYNPNAGTVVQPIEALVGQDCPARYRSIDWSDYRSRRTDGDYADYGTEVQISQFRI